MTSAAVFLTLSLAGMFYGWAANRPALLIIGFWAFLVSCALVDVAGDRRNARASDSLNHTDMTRVGYEKDRAA